MAYNAFSRSALRQKKKTTTASADFSLRLAPSPFQAQGKISPGKNAILHRTTAGSTLPPLDHESFAVACPLALVGIALYPILVHRLAASLHASSPHSVTLMQLRFTSFAVVNSRWDFHPQDCAHAGRTSTKATRRWPLSGVASGQREAYLIAQPVSSDRALPMSASERTVFTPASSRAANFSSAVPLPPEMIAPAWPMRLPAGAVTPAM